MMIGLFYINDKKLQDELSLARIHFWLEGKENIELFRLSTLDSLGENSALYKVLSSPGITSEKIVELIKHLLSMNRRATFDELLRLMNLPEFTKGRILKGLKEKYNDN